MPGHGVLPLFNPDLTYYLRIDRCRGKPASSISVIPLPPSDHARPLSHHSACRHPIQLITPIAAIIKVAHSCIEGWRKVETQAASHAVTVTLFWPFGLSCMAVSRFSSGNHARYGQMTSGRLKRRHPALWPGYHRHTQISFFLLLAER